MGFPLISFQHPAASRKEPFLLPPCLLYLNAIFDLPLASQLSAYADDVKLYGILSETSSLMDNLLIVKFWSDRNLMQINVEKWGALHFGNKTPNIPIHMVNSAQLPCPESYKDLGILIDSQLLFKHHIAALMKKSFLMSKS